MPCATDPSGLVGLPGIFPAILEAERVSSFSIARVAGLIILQSLLLVDEVRTLMDDFSTIK